MVTGPNSLRIDRWLFFCRFYKTRTLATQAVAAGHVLKNGNKIGPGDKLSVGDVVDLNRDRLPYRFSVVGIPTRRGPAAEAKTLYEEDTDSVARRIEITDALKRDRRTMPSTPGRPDKHTRRLLRNRNRGD